MRPLFRSLACAVLALMASACATFGTNVEGSFQCRAPQGDCAPSHVLDARATSAMTNAQSLEHSNLRPSRMVAAGDQGRTSERTLRIVFPARVDEAGTLHDEAVAWAVVENPRWAAELRRKPGDAPMPPLMRQLKRQLKSFQTAAKAQAQPDTSAMADEHGALPPDALADGVSDTEGLLQSVPQPDLFPLVSPPVAPSPARETGTGADAPVAGGLHATASPHDSAPRLSNSPAPLTFPSIEAIEAAKRDAAASKDPE